MMNIVIIITDNYPRKFSATNIKAEFIARGLSAKGCKVTIVDVPYGTNGVYSLTEGRTQTGVDYIQLPQTNQSIGKAWGNLSFYKEIFRKLYQPGEDNVVFFGFFFLPFYLRLCNIANKCGYRKYLLYHEWNIKTPHNSCISAIEDYVMTFSFGYFLDGIFPISHFLEKKCRMFRKPQMILPIMAEFNEAHVRPIVGNHFSFCANVDYLLRNKIILDAFEELYLKRDDANLYLVLFGEEKKMQQLQAYLETLKSKNNIFIKSKVPQEELIDLYKKSVALIIPLDPKSVADKARFSQKIAEYLSSSRPVITNNVGEIPYYFTDRKDIIIADYTVDGFLKAMLFAISDKDAATKIGEQGFLKGRQEFGIDNNCNRIIDFIEKNL